MSISEIAIKRPLLIVVIFTSLTLFGVMSYNLLNYNLLPKIEVNNVSVVTVYPGASASEVENSVTKKLEDAFASVEGLDNITSTSQEGVSQIAVALKASTNLDQAERNIQREADKILNELPDNIEKPLVSKVNLDETPVLKAGVTSSLSSRDLYDLIDNEITPILQNVAGVGKVNIIGGDERQIQINIIPQKLRSYNLSIDQVTQAISRANQSFPAGKIETQDNSVSIRFDANVTSVDQVRNLIISNNRFSTVYLYDVAEVLDATSEPTAINHVDGSPSIGIQVVKQGDANGVEVSEQVKKAFADLETEYSQQALSFVVSSDQSIYTLASAHAVMEDLLLAVIIVGIVMLAFLHSFKSSLFVMVALPCSIIPTFIAMYFFDFSLNLMSLMALSLVVGILVDDSIVVLENIYRHMEMGKNRKVAALEGRSEIGFTALAITLVDVVVFLPLAISGGIIGSILREFSLVVVFSTLMSLFVSFTVTPMLASRFGKLEHLNGKTLWGRINLAIEDFLSRLKNYYGKTLAFALEKKRWLLSGILVLIIGSFALVGTGFIGFAFIPESDQGELIINMELEPTASIYQTNLLSQDVEQILMDQPQVKRVFTSVGFVSGSVSGTGSNGNLAELTVSLVDQSERTVNSQEFGMHMQKILTQSIPGVKFSASATSISGGGSQIPIQIAVKGLDIEKVRLTADRLKEIVATVPGTQYVKLSVKDQKQEIEVTLDREKMALLGLDASQVGTVLQNSFSGNTQNKLKEKGNEYDINVSLAQNNKSSINDVRELTFTNSDGQSFELSQFASVNSVLGESVLQRNGRISAITVQSNVIGRPTGSVSAEIEALISQEDLPAGINIEYLGESKNQGEAFGSLGLALISAILLVYLIMVALYESVVYPFVVLFSVPVAIIGALLALALSMQTLNIFSIIGLIMLLGLVTKNAILIVDFTNNLRAEGASIKEALIEAGEERLRPILMTTLAMVFGMLPIALASGAGAEIKNGMAWVIIGGLTSSMILTLFIVPAMYLIIENIRLRFSKNKDIQPTISTNPLTT